MKNNEEIHTNVKYIFYFKHHGRLEWLCRIFLLGYTLNNSVGSSYNERVDFEGIQDLTIHKRENVGKAACILVTFSRQLIKNFFKRKL